jgi:hypothetical protein
MSSLKDLRVIQKSLKEKLGKELIKVEEEMLDLIFKDLEILTGLDFQVHDGYDETIIVKATDEEESEYIYIMLTTETLELQEIDDQTEDRKYFYIIQWYLDNGIRIPKFVLDLIKVNKLLKEEIFRLRN